MVVRMKGLESSFITFLTIPYSVSKARIIGVVLLF